MKNIKKYDFDFFLEGEIRYYKINNKTERDFINMLFMYNDPVQIYEYWYHSANIIAVKKIVKN